MVNALSKCIDKINGLLRSNLIQCPFIIVLILIYYFQDEYLDENYDDSYGQYPDQYMADASGTAGQQINPGDADKGRRQLTSLTFLQQCMS